MSKTLTRAHWNLQSQAGAWTPKREAIEHAIERMTNIGGPWVFSFNEAAGRIRELQRLADRIDAHLFVPAGEGGAAVPILTSAKPRHSDYRVLLRRVPGVTNKTKGVSWVRMDGGYVEATSHFPAHPDTSKGDDRKRTRKAYAVMMSGLVVWVGDRRPDAPVRHVGDMNTIPSSPLVDPLAHAGLRQVVHDPTFGRRILDQGWVSEALIIPSPGAVVVKTPGKDHSIVIIPGRKRAA